MTDHREVGQDTSDVIPKLPWSLARGQVGSSSTDRHSMWVNFSPIAAPVIVTPSSPVRQMVSATRFVFWRVGPMVCSDVVSEPSSSQPRAHYILCLT